MNTLITVRLLDRFDPRVDLLRRMHYGDEPFPQSLRDAFDTGCHFLVAYAFGEAIGSVRLSPSETGPLAHWAPDARLVRGTHAVQINRGVVAKEFRRMGLSRLLVGEAMIAAHRLGYRIANAVVEPDCGLGALLKRVGFANVGNVIPAKLGPFECKVQSIEAPVGASQAAAQKQFEKARGQLHSAGYTVRSMVPTDLQSMGIAVQAQRAFADTLRTSDPKPSAALEKPPALQIAAENRGGSIPLGWWRWLRCSVAMIAVTTPLFLIAELWWLEMSLATALFARAIFALVLGLGVSVFCVAIRKGSLAFWKVRVGEVNGWMRHAHDTLLASGACGVVGMAVYAFVGLTPAQVLDGATIALAVGGICGPIIGLVFDRNQRAANQSRRRYDQQRGASRRANDDTRWQPSLLG